jgi:kumamolisin
LPTEAGYRAVLQWLAATGLTVQKTYENRVTIEVAGSVGTVRQALKVRFKRVRVEGAEFLATDETPVVPSAIAAVIAGVNGLQPYRHMDKLSWLKPGAPVATLSGMQAASVISGNYFPGGVLEAYQAVPFLSQSGKGTITAVLIDTFPNPSDLTQFYSLIGSSQTLSNITFIQAVAGALPAPSGEETLDTEYTSGVGYGSKVRVYATKDLSFAHLDTGYQAILSDLNKGLKIRQLSVSLGFCEPFSPLLEVETQTNLLTLIAQKNVSIFIASGDSGALECVRFGENNPPFPAFASTVPVVTAVGGTHLITATAGTSHLVIKSETAWSGDGLQGGSGGGLSNEFDTPSYQKFLGVPTRAVPDVAADADPATGVDIVLNGNTIEIGGTSAAAPIWAGLASLINQARAAAGKPPLGPLNPRIYPILQTTAYTKNFHDVTKGNNGFPAGPGYDLVTGLGSPIMNVLLPTLVAQP